MSQALIESLPSEVKIWLAHAVAGVITADGIVTESELEFLRETINFLESVDDINSVVSIVKNKEKPALKTLKTDPKTAAKILIHLATIAITDGKLDPSEVDFFKYVGKKMGFEWSFSEEILNWGKDYIQINKRKKAILRRASKYHTA